MSTRDLRPQRGSRDRDVLGRPRFICRCRFICHIPANAFRAFRDRVRGKVRIASAAVGAWSHARVPATAAGARAREAVALDILAACASRGRAHAMTTSAACPASEVGALIVGATFPASFQHALASLEVRWDGAAAAVRRIFGLHLKQRRRVAVLQLHALLLGGATQRVAWESQSNINVCRRKFL